MRKLVIKLDKPLDDAVNNPRVSALFTKLAHHYGLYTQGLHWEYTPLFTQLFPHISDMLMGWPARRVRSTNRRLLLRLANRTRPVVDVWWR